MGPAAELADAVVTERMRMVSVCELRVSKG